MNEFIALRVNNEDGRVISGQQRLTVAELPAGDVLIKADYSSVNYKDALAVTGKGKIISSFPLTAGIDVAGHVVESNSADIKEGDPVLVTGYDFGVAHDGGYAEYARVPAEWVIPIPGSMSTYTAMALGTAGFTVALCIHRLQQNGQTPEKGPFIVTGATGGVGSIAVNVLSNLGYKVVASTGKIEEIDWLRRLGASRIINRHDINLDHAPLLKGEWGGAIDNVGGDTLNWLLSSTRSWGNIASVGLAGGSHLNTTVMPFILRGVSLLGVTSAGCPTPIRRDLWQRLATDLMPDKLDEIVTAVVELDQLAGVFDAMLAGKGKGRTVVKINEEIQ